jgi:hypothetical protein
MTVRAEARRRGEKEKDFTRSREGAKMFHLAEGPSPLTGIAAGTIGGAEGGFAAGHNIFAPSRLRVKSPSNFSGPLRLRANPFFGSPA